MRAQPGNKKEREREKENQGEKPKRKSTRKKKQSLTSRPKGIEHNATILDLRKIHDTIYK